MMSPTSPKKLQWTKAKASSEAKIPELSQEEWTQHAYFAGACFLSKTLFRSVLRVIATKGVSLVNFWYPFIATIACVHHERHPSVYDKKSKQQYQYWFQYWTLYALAQALDHFLLQLSHVFFRQASSIALLNQWMEEINLFFTIYLLVLPSATSLCYGLVQPHVRKAYYQISETMSAETWNTLISSRVEQFLELMVSVHIVQPYWKDLIIGILKESRTMVVPAGLTLLPLTPSLFRRLGVVYSQFLLPVGKHCGVTKKSQQLQSLQYWILHSLVSIVFEALRYFWWMPFYDHSMFLFWAYLSFDATIKQYYTILELDLISLGLLPGDEKIKVGVHETQTVQLLTAIAKKIPSADRAELEKLIEQGKGEQPAVITSRSVQQQKGGLQWSEERLQPKRVAVEREPQDVTDQLKSLIRQLPIEDQEDLDDEKTKQLLDMLMQQLKKEEEKVVQQDETLSPARTSNARLGPSFSSKRQIHHPPSTSLSSLSSGSDVFYESKSTQGSSRRTVTMREREESFQTARDMDIRQSSTLESTASMNTISTTSDSNDAGKYYYEEEEEEASQYHAMALDERTTKTRVSTLDAVVVDMKSHTTSTKEAAPSPSRVAMSEPRLKRERVKAPKQQPQQSSGSLVSRFVEGLEAKQRARRRDKREKKLQEKKKAKLKKSS